MTISDLQDRAGRNAKAKGFINLDRTLGDELMLVVSELGEALEEFRNGHSPDEIYYKGSCGCVSRGQCTCPTDCINCSVKKPEGIPIELADAVIRIGQMAFRFGFDLESAIKAKMDYNDTRPYLHGGKKL